MQVIERLSYPIILGTDFLQEHRAKIDCVNQCLELQDGITVVSFIGAQPKAGLARLICNINIAPRSAMTVKVKTSLASGNKTCLLEPVSNLPSKLKIMGARCVTQLNGKYSTYQILNPTNTEVQLRQNEHVAVIRDLPNGGIVKNSKGGEVNLINQSKSAGKGTAASNSNTNHWEQYTENMSDERLIEVAKELGINLGNSQLSPEEKVEMFKFLGKNRDVFAKDMSELGCTNLYHHNVDTGDASPIRQRFYRTTPMAKAEIERQTKEMLDNEVIEEANTPWQSPVVLVKKQNGEYRFAVDYRKVNKVSKPMSFPIPRFEDISDTIAQSKAQYYSSLDLRAGFWQIPLSDEAKPKTGFITHQGVYQFRKIPFGLNSSPAAFTMVMTEVLRDLNWKFALVYIDDILVFSSSFESHLDHLSQVFQRLRDANLRLKPSKCEFAVKEVKYLGHLFSKDGIAVDVGKGKGYDRVSYTKVST